MKLAIIGTRGIPAQYGGFETFAEKLVENLHDKLDITVYCSSKYYKEKPKTYKGARLVYLPIKANNASGVIYDTISLFLTLPKYDRVLMLGAPAGVILPFFGSLTKKIVFNYGGLDFNRSKWNSFIQKYIKWGKDVATKFSSQVISDNLGIQDFLLEENNRKSTMIPYGGDHVYQDFANEYDKKEYKFINSKYALVVARIQRDNNIEMVLRAFEENSYSLPLVIIGNWQNSEYGRKLKIEFERKSNLYLLEAIYDQKKLDRIRKSCYLYIHGHSAGGTNPSLVEAMYMELPIFAFNSLFNKYTMHNKGVYFNNVEELSDLVKNLNDQELETLKKEMKTIADAEYTWKKISAAYLEVIKK